MSEIKHTPSPWHVGKDCEAGVERGFFVGGGRRVLANLGGSEEHQRADAFLIAAAPDMLEALKAYVSAFDALGAGYPLCIDGKPIDHKPFNLARDLADRAIAKAEGRS